MPDYLRPVVNRQDSAASTKYRQRYEEKKIEFDFEFDDPYEELLGSHPVFLREQGIRGNITVKTTVADLKIDKIELALKGTIRQAINHECERHWRPYKFAGNAEIFKLVDVQESHSLREQQPAGASESFPFNFSLYSAIASSRDLEDEHRPKQIPAVIPSSHCLKSVDGTWCAESKPAQFGQQRPRCRVESVVEYELQAFAHCGDDVIQGQGIPVTIYDAPSRLCAALSMAASKSRRKFSRSVSYKRATHDGKTKRSRLNVEIEEPEPTSVFKSGALATVPIRVELADEDSRKDDTPPAPLKVSLDAFLASSTLISVCPMGTDKPEDSPVDQPWQAKLQRFGRNFNATFEISNWQRETPPTSDSESSETSSLASGASSIASDASGQPSWIPSRIRQTQQPSRPWIAETTLLIPLAFTSSIPPSFFTPHVSRDYAININLQLEQGGANKRFSLTKVAGMKNSINFNVPVEIVYPSENGVFAPSYEQATRCSSGTSTPALTRRSSAYVHLPERLPVYVR